MNVWGRMKDVRAEGSQVSAGSPSSEMGFYELYKGDGHLLTDDPDGHLDFQRRHEVVMSYSWLTDEGVAGVVGGALEGVLFFFGLCSSCFGAWGG